MTILGETLKDRITREKLTLPRALEIASEISQALARAHNEGIVHRDLKPSNIMLTSDGHVKVMDFGLAKRVSGADSEVGETRTGLTEYGSMVGTVSYMSPEQIRGGEVDARSDVFSFGLVLYELLAGAHPFPRRTDLETASAIL